MTHGIDESTALAILEYARNLSGGDESGVNHVGPCLTGPKDGVNAPPAQIQFPSESGHWYDPKTGNQVTLPPRTWTKTYLKHGYVPGVTTITRQLHKEALRKYDVNRAIKFAQDALAGDWMDADTCVSHVLDLMKAESEAITGRGKELHGAIELFSQGKPFDSKWKSHVENILSTICDHGINLDNGNAEHTFATSRYGGKIDWHNDEWLLDFKTRENLDEDTQWALMRKGNTKATKLFDFKHEAEQAIVSDEYYIEPRRNLVWPEHAQQLSAYKEGLVLAAIRVGHDRYHRRCANVFIGIEDQGVIFHEWPEKDLLKGWRKFQALLDVWWADYL